MRTSESDQHFLKLVVKTVITSVSDMNGSLESAEKILVPGLVSNLYNLSFLKHAPEWLVHALFRRGALFL